MGVEVETVGFGVTKYDLGQYQNTFLIDAYTTEGLYFEAVTGGAVTSVLGLELNIVTGLGIDWNTKAKHIELHGADHWSTALSDGWYQQNTNFSATSIGSHTQKVEGSTTWTSASGFILKTSTTKAPINITTVGDGTISLVAGAGSLALAATATTLAGSDTSVTGTTKVQLTGGGNSVLLNATKASLMCGNAGITATATSTVISGATVEIGLPNAPVPVATATEVANATALQTTLNTSVTKLEKELELLKGKISKSVFGKFLDLLPKPK
jgi:hypothetical protein